MTIDLEKLYHVRAVTHTDVVRAGTKDISKIFQILYDVNAVNGGNYAPAAAAAITASESLLSSNSSGSSKKAIVAALTSLYPNSSSNNSNNNSSTNLENSPLSTLSSSSAILQQNGTNVNNGSNSLSTTTLHDHHLSGDNVIGSSFRLAATAGGLDEPHAYRLNSDAISIGSNDSADKHKDGKLFIKGHKFIDIKYRMPTYCDSCNKPLSDLFNPPAALECLCKWNFLFILKKNLSSFEIFFYF